MLATAASAEEPHSCPCPHGCPAGAPRTNDVVVREIYVVSSNDTTKFDDCVGYRVTADWIGPMAQRRWRMDPAVTIEPDDYRGVNAELGTDRGHHAPLSSGHQRVRDHELPVEHHPAAERAQSARVEVAGGRCVAASQEAGAARERTS